MIKKSGYSIKTGKGAKGISLTNCCGEKEYSLRTLYFQAIDCSESKEYSFQDLKITRDKASSSIITENFKSSLKLYFEEERIKVGFRAESLTSTDREMRFLLRVPLPDSLYPYNRDWKFWTATKNYPLDLWDVITHHIEYGGADGGTIIPALTIYNSKDDIGLTFLKPLTQKIPRFKFIIRRNKKYFDIEYSYLMLPAGGKCQADLEIYFHAGDWRCGLGKIYENYKTYFIPSNRSVNSQHIYLTMTGWGSKEKPTCEYLKKMLNTTNKGIDINFSEVHNYFPAYGNYLPEEQDEWMNVRLIEGRHKETHRVSKEMIKQHLKDLNKLGIKPLLYFQFQGDCDRDLANRKFADSIVRQEDGSTISAWIGTVMMNGDRELSFGKHLLRQAKYILEMYGEEIGGFFWDQPCYGYYDFAHSDGITMINGKPAYKISFVYEQHLKRLLPELKKRNMVIMGNGPYDIEVGKGLDAIMSEGGGWLEHHAWLCLARPLLGFYYHKDAQQCERIFQRCLKYGAFPCAPIGVNTEEIRDIYLKYKKFFMLLAGREWVLEKEPIEFSAGWDGNIFIVPNGYVAFLIRTLSGLSTRKKAACSLKLKKSIRKQGEIKVIGLSGKELNCKVEIEKRKIVLQISQPEDVNAIVITK